MWTVGSIYQRTADQLWCVALNGSGGSRTRRVVTAKSREVLLERIQAMIASGDAVLAEPAISRSAAMVEARAKGRHTPEEWRDKQRATSACRYCGTALNLWNAVKDHIIPVNRGGSDGIDNVQAICWQCNSDKSDELDYEYAGDVRPFSVIPQRRPEYRRHMHAVAVHQKTRATRKVTS